MKERWKLLIIIVLFAAAYYVPWASPVIRRSGLEAFLMLQEYAREHVLTCLIPAFFIAGAIAVFVSQASVLKYFGAKANKILSYSVASISGTVLAVCSCTVLPLFAGIYTRGAGIGPATAFLYSGPAINVLAIVLTARILGLAIRSGQGHWRDRFRGHYRTAHGLHFSEGRRSKGTRGNLPAGRGRPGSNPYPGCPLHAHHGAHPRSLPPLQDLPQGSSGLWPAIFAAKWYITAGLLIVLGFMLKAWFLKEERVTWVQSTWGFMKQIFPLLAAGVLVAGFMLGRPGHAALIPDQYIESLVGGNSLWANLFASVSGALMYFATLTEVPILQGLIGAGMGKGPALSLLLAGPALSLPNMLVIGGIMGAKKTAVFCGIIVVLSTIAGMGYGWLMG